MVQKHKKDTIPNEHKGQHFLGFSEESASQPNERKTVVIGKYYASLINVQIESSHKRETPRKAVSGSEVNYSNALVHTIVVAKPAIRQCGIQDLNHPQYSP